MWLNFNPPPIEMSSTLFHFSPEIVSIEMSVTVKKTTIRNKPPKRCVLKVHFHFHSPHLFSTFHCIFKELILVWSSNISFKKCTANKKTHAEMRHGNASFVFILFLTVIAILCISNFPNVS